MDVEKGKYRRRTGAAVVAAAGVLAAVAAIVAPAAQAQEPAICGQYEGLPQCLPNEPGAVGDTGDEGSSGGGGTPGAQTDSDSGSGSAPGALPGSGGGPGGSVAAGAGAGGELPFTGYPLTPLVWLLLALLAAGLTLRAYLAVRERIRARAGANPA